MGSSQCVTTSTHPRGTFTHQIRCDNIDNPVGRLGGLRPLLDNYGISFTLNQTSDYLGNTRGGIKQGFVYDGLLDLELDIDLDKAIGWHGGEKSTSPVTVFKGEISPPRISAT